MKGREGCRMMREIGKSHMKQEMDTGHLDTRKCRGNNLNDKARKDSAEGHNLEV